MRRVETWTVTTKVTVEVQQTKDGTWAATAPTTGDTRERFVRIVSNDRTLAVHTALEQAGWKNPRRAP